jgi:hypothetical protein
VTATADSRASRRGGDEFAMNGIPTNAEGKACADGTCGGKPSARGPRSSGHPMRGGHRGRSGRAEGGRVTQRVGSNRGGTRPDL